MRKIKYIIIIVILLFLSCISSIVGKKIVKYEYPNYKSFTEYKTNATVMEIAIDEKTDKIWASNIFQTEDGICLGYYSNGKFVPVISSRDISDNANTSFKAQSFYKSGDSLFFNPRYSPYIYIIENNEVRKYMKIVSENFIDDSDLESENKFKKEKGIRLQYSTDECIISGVNSFYKCKGNYLAEIWRNHGAPLLLKYESKEKNGYLFCPLLDTNIRAYTKILAVSSDFYISYINAHSFIDKYKNADKYNLREDSNPVLMNIYIYDY